VPIVVATPLLAFVALSLTACKARSDRAASETAAGTVTLTDTAAQPAATLAPAGDTALAAVSPAPKPAKVYPPFDANASAKTAGVVVYPKEGQSTKQQQLDENECFAWAKKNTGIDPNAPEPAAAPAAEVPKGGTVKGAAKGTVAGVAIGAIAGDAGKGAAIGAVAGGIAGRRGQKRTEQAAASDAQQQAASSSTQRKQTFADSFGACMGGRAYSVK